MRRVHRWGFTFVVACVASACAAANSPRTVTRWTSGEPSATGSQTGRTPYPSAQGCTRSLGDSASFDEKIVMSGRAITADSIVGTWTETIVCCSAAGRFALWR